MDADEQVGFCFIGNVRSFVQSHKFVGGASIDDFYALAVLFYQRTEGQRNFQVDVLFLAPASYGSRVLAPMSGVYDKRICMYA